MKTNALFIVALAPALFLSGTVHAQIYVLGDYINEYGLDGSLLQHAYIPDHNGNCFAIAGNDMFLASSSPYDNISEFGLDGSVISYPLMSGPGNTRLGAPLENGLAISGGDMFVVYQATPPGTIHIGEYGLDGSTINSELITFQGAGPHNIAISGNDLFMTTGNNIAEFSVLNGALITGALLGAGANLNLASGLAISGNDMFVSSYDGGTVGEFGLDGSIINASLLSGLSHPGGLAVSGSGLYVLDDSGQNIGEYGLDGSTINASLINGQFDGNMTEIAVVPEPSSVALAALGISSCVWFRRRSKP